MQKCKKCGEIKTEDSFYKEKNTKSGLRGICKICWDIASKDYYKKNKERIRDGQRKWRRENREKIRAYKKSHKWREDRREWRKKNREKINEYNRIREKNNPKLRIAGAMRRSIHRAIGREKNNSKWEKLVDYSFNDLMKHLESQFEDWMTWDNYGKWHIDHIKPISLFNFTKPDDPEFKECWALKNLQPLEARENIRKQNRYIG
jgi:hypothetical protein